MRPLLGEGLALVGFVLVLLGLIGTTRLFREEYLGPVPEVIKGFVPMAAGATGEAAPSLGSAAQPGPRPQVTLVLPAERAALALATATPAGLTALPPVETPAASQALAAGEASTESEAPAESLSEPAPSATLAPIIPGPPEWIDIPALGLAAPVVRTGAQPVRISGQDLQQWSAPDSFAAGWHDGSAQLGQVGNTVLNGHHNIHGSVFARLQDLAPGDQIIIWSGERVFFYQVDRTMILEERNASLTERLENARWILPSDDERLTLVTCWPPESNTHRLIVVARPIF